MISYRSLLAALLVAVLPVTSFAQSRPAPRPAVPQARPMPAPQRPMPMPQRPMPMPQRPMPAPARPIQPPARPPSGFNMPHEVSPSHNITPQSGRGAFYSGPYRGWHGAPVGNPYHWHPWGWNRGVVWYPAPIYWGWGFWGPWVIGTTYGVVLYGSIIDYDDHIIYPSYEIEPSSPGAQLLQNYGLQQTQCGPPNLVVIWGPGTSVICAFPNNLVGAGNYSFDPSTLTIESLNTPPNQ
jgi:hypothetical protein